MVSVLGTLLVSGFFCVAKLCACINVEKKDILSVMVSVMGTSLVTEFFLRFNAQLLIIIIVIKIIVAWAN